MRFGIKKNMPIPLTWPEIVLRLSCALATGAVIGLNRTGHDRPAGLRTSILVCLAACIAMLQVNLLLSLRGRTSDSFVMNDLMRLPLGILSGMGFIGAGAIVRRQKLVVGVTTAATMWFLTVLGLCFGGGQTILGIAGGRDDSPSGPQAYCPAGRGSGGMDVGREVKRAVPLSENE